MIHRFRTGSILTALALTLAGCGDSASKDETPHGSEGKREAEAETPAPKYGPDAPEAPVTPSPVPSLPETPKTIPADKPAEAKPEPPK